MAVEVLCKLILRDLATVREEVLLYDDEADLWKEAPGVRNPGGNLALHLCGNLQHFIGATLTDSGYVRDRDREFMARNIPREDLVAEIDAALGAVAKAFEAMTDDMLQAEFPLELAGAKLGTQLFLTHLCSHLGYHLGQLDYHRRFVTGSDENPEALSLAALAE